MVQNKPPLESKIQSDILKWLKRRPNTVTYKHCPDPAGIPDIHHIEKGHAFYFEVKRTAKDKARYLQRLRIRDLRKAGATAKVVRSVDDVEKQIRKFYKGLS